MKKWLRRIRGAVVMGLTWAVGWTLLGMLGVLVFYTLFPSVPDVVDMWIPVFAYPGFLCGAVFSAVLGIAEGRRRLDELSLSRVGAFGAVSGVLVGVLPFVLGSSEASGLPAWLLGVLIIGSLTLLSAASADGSLALAKWWRRRNCSPPVLT